ncbi:chromosome segregation protein SMC [Clostridiales bacterium COT073_COT-073]|nr:chromosome segregation protein SMC [Clostridiales bacterium COT073_COT-073]
MYLKSVELYGFKSFPNKINFQFEHGITAIVGPNGSGKSNIADAVRWVLGEQSAKQLRGSSMQDVIFAGTETRKPLGYCQVDLTIDNSDKTLPIDYSEVKISRRVYRSGESDYMINGGACRLKDIHSLFMDTGVGKEGYSIIGQGQIEKILSAKPEDRRMLFDEAAGIVKFKERKAAALQKLEEETFDLARLSDLIGELEKQEKVLAEQAITAREYLRLRDDLRKYEINSFIRLMDSFEENLKNLTEKNEIILADLHKRKKEYESREKEYEEVAEALRAKDREYEQVSELAHSKKLEAERALAEIRLDQERISNLVNNYTNLQSRAEEFYEAQLRGEKELVSMKYQDEKEKAVLIKHQNEIRAFEQDKKELEMAIEAENQKKTDYQSQRLNQIRQKAESETALGRIALEKENNSKRQQAIIARQAVLTRTVAVMVEEIKAFETTEESLLQKQDQLLKTKTKNAKLMAEAMRQFSDLENRKSHLRGEYQEKESRQKALVDLENNYDGYFLAVKKVLDLKNPGIIGVVADILEVEEKYQKAIETALGNRLQNIITDTDADAEQAIEYLKQNKLGRATFLPMNTVTAVKAKEIFREKGYLGIAADLVKYDPKFENIVQSLLGNLFVTDNLQNARYLAAKYQYKLRIITLDGDVLSPGGSMTGGEFKNAKSMIFSRKNDIAKLEKELNELKAELDKADQEFLRQKEKNSELQKETESILAQERETNAEMDRLVFVLAQKKKELTAQQTECLQLETETIEIKECLQRLEKEKGWWLENTGHLSEENLQAEQDKAEERLQTLQSDLDCVNEDIVKVRMQVTAIEERLSHTEERSQVIRTTIAEAAEKQAQLKRELSALNLEKLKKEQALAEQQEILTQTSAIQEQAEEQRVVLKHEKSLIQAKKENLQTNKENHYKEVALLEKEQIRLNMQIDKYTEQKESQAEYMWTEYELTYSTAKAWEEPDLGSDTALKSNMKRLKEEMKALGDVNVGAIHEYEEVKQRLDFNIVQQADILEAEARLKEMIADLEKQMTERFEQEFAEINRRFAKVFQELFGGGIGYLSLTEKENVLESGIAIHVQPPGKKLKNMMLLSGGERSFTAIALLFAIQSLRPSPFCILDEIEAALDDANVYKFAKYLHKLTSDTQFIVITHRKGTMESADALYGITMQEKGVSTQVSVKMIENDLDKKEE